MKAKAQRDEANWPRVIVISSIIVIAIYLAWAWINNRVFVPREFLEARERGANIADSIVGLSRESVGNLKQIGLLNQEKNYLGGLNLVAQEIQRNEETRKKAIELSTELETMAEQIESLKPKKASDLALQAIITESQIAQRLINYNGLINELMDQFRSHFQKSGEFDDDKIKATIDQMNAEISAINDLNNKYRDLMQSFDAATK